MAHLLLPLMSINVDLSVGQKISNRKDINIGTHWYAKERWIFSQQLYYDSYICHADVTLLGICITKAY